MDKDTHKPMDLHLSETFPPPTWEEWLKAVEDTLQGVYVETVEPGGWAVLAHMSVGDLLLSVESSAVKDTAGLEAAMKDLAAKHPKHVVFFVRRGIHTLYLEVEPDWSRQKQAK